jgi:hypothetical protein
MTVQCLKKAFWLLLALFVLTTLALGLIDSGLRTSATPGGIVSFEFCAFTGSCETALEQWGSRGQALAMLSLGIDYVYLLVYPGLIAVGLLLVTARLGPELVRRTRLAAWSCTLISLADAMENYALIQLVLNAPASGYGLWAGSFATLKFALLGLTLSWLLFVGVKYALPNRA